MSNNDSLLDVVVLLYKWKKHILIATIISAIVAAGLSLLMPNYYQASTQFYAASPDLARPSPIGDSESKIRIYGNDEDVDRLISIAKSNVITDYLIDNYSLFEHYDIKPDTKHAKHKLLQKLNKLYQVTKTKYDAINLSIEDEDINRSANMANGARETIRDIAQNIIKESQLNSINSHKKNIAEKQKNLSILVDSLFKVRDRYNIFSTASQGEAYGTTLVSVQGKLENARAQASYLESVNAPRDSISLLKAKANGYQKQLTTIKKDIVDYNSGYPTIITLERDIKNYGVQLSTSQERLKLLQAAYNSDFSTIHLIEKAETPVYKSRPKRTIIVLGVAIMTFILASLWILLQDQFRQKNWKEEIRNA